MALKGTIKDFSLADIFQLIGIQRKTGILTLQRDHELVTVSFVGGNVVGAEWANRRLEERLGTVLVKSGRVSEGQLRQALKIQRNTLKRLGHVLVEIRAIDAESLRDALDTQISQTVYRLFRWNTGDYHFAQEDRVDYDEAHITPMSAESILMEGARILDEWPMIEKGIKSFSTVYRKADVEITHVTSEGSLPQSRQAAAGAVTLNEAEGLVHSLVDGVRSVQDIVERSRLSEFDTCRVLYELINRQLIEEVGAVAEVRPGPKKAGRSVSSAILLGLAYMLLVVVAGGAFLFQGQSWVRSCLRGDFIDAVLTPVISREEVAILSSSVGRSHLQRVDFAIQVYFLLNRGYPLELRHLVTSDLLRPDEVSDARGRKFNYEIVSGGYLLNTPRAEDSP